MARESPSNPPIPTAPTRRRWFDRFFSLQVKATALVAILTLTVTGAVAGYLLRYSGRLAREQHDLQLMHSASLLAKAAGLAIASGDQRSLEEVAKAAANGAPLVYVMITDTSGQELTVAQHRTISLIGRPSGQGSGTSAPVDESFSNAQALTTGTASAPVLLAVTYPITQRSAAAGAASKGKELVGYVRTGMIADEWERTMSTRLDMVIGVGIIATVAAIPLGFFLVRRVVGPIEALAGTILHFSQGRMDVRSPVKRRDEIGRLTEAFNRMADQHQTTHERIVRLNAELEQRVAHRTRQLRELASREPLTGLYNRRYFSEVLERSFAEAVRYQTDLSCIMIDLDAFKEANDRFGHHVGDELLILTATTITGQLRTADVAARYGGDEFILLLPQTDAQNARSLAERVVEKFNRESRDRFPGIAVTMSLGVASLRSTGVQDVEALVRIADQSLLDAKASGKHCIVVAPPAQPVTA